MANRARVRLDALPMGRFVVLCLAIVIAAAGNLGAGQIATSLATVPVFNGESCGGVAPDIVVRVLVAARFESLPTVPAVFEVHRATFLPAGSISAAAQPGPTAIFVDSGAITMHTAGTATVTRAVVPGTDANSDPLLTAGIVSLRYSDQLAVPEGVAFGAVNEGSVPAVLLVARVVPPASRLLPAFAAAGGPSIAWDLLADGVTSEMPPVPAILAVTRVVYAVGAGDQAPSENAGPLLVAIEAGMIGYRVTAGVSAVVRVEAETTSLVSSGTEETLLTGDYVVEQWGAISAIRNVGDERAWVLITTILPTSESAASAVGHPPTAPDRAAVCASP